MNLMLALFCLAAGIAMLAHQALTGEQRFVIRGTPFSAGWLLLLLAAYNATRWWSSYSWRREQQRLREEQGVRLRQIRDHDRPPPDPTFDFSDREPETRTRNEEGSAGPQS